jgi:hypothetical protein
MYQNDLSQENDNKESGAGLVRIVVTLQDFGTNQSCASTPNEAAHGAAPPYRLRFAELRNGAERSLNGPIPDEYRPEHSSNVEFATSVNIDTGGEFVALPATAGGAAPTEA